MSLLKLLTVESQVNDKIFEDLEIFFKNLHNQQWLKHYIFWELNLFKFLGYDLNLKNIVIPEFKNNKKRYFVKSNSISKNVPNFLIDENDDHVDYDTLISGLNLVTDYLNKSILIPNNITQPYSRINFINILK